MSSADRRALLEARLRAKGLEAPTSPRIAPQPPRPDGVVSLSPGQRRFWFLERLHPGTAEHNVACVLVCRGELQPGRVEPALQEVATRHAVLRTRFDADGQTAIVSPPAEFQVDFGHAAPDDAGAAAADIAAGPFDLEAAPPWRARLLHGPDSDEWRLVLVFHHALMDAWSLDLFLADLGRAYDGESLAPPPPVAYSDFAAWQLSRAGTREESGDVQWWRTRLSGAPVLDLPTDRPRPPARSGRGATVEFELDDNTSDRLGSLAQQTGSTIAMVGTTAFAALLARWAAQEEVIVGIPVAGRDRREVEDVIGFFVNTLPLRIGLGGRPSVAEAVSRVRGATLEALAHAGVPFERLVKELAPSRDLSTPPINQVLFTHQTAPEQIRMGFAGLDVEVQGVPTGTAKLDLAMVLQEGPAGLRGALEYDTDLFDPSTAARLVDHYCRMLAAFALNPAVKLDSIDLLDPGEASEVAAWSDGGPALVHAGESAATLLASTVTAHSERPAVVYGTRVVPYGELDDLIEKHAGTLRSQGVGPGDLVGVSWRRSPEAIAALLAAHRVGAAFLPLDPDYPASRLKFMAEDARPAAILCGPDVDSLPLALGSRAARPPGGVSLQGAAYVIYTSGSTGRPKGAVIGHAGLVAMARAVVARLGMVPEDRVLQFAAHSFDAAVYEIFTTIAAGAALVVADPEHLLPGEPLARTLAAQEVSVATLPPSALAALPRTAAEELRRLRTLVVAGEVCAPSLVNVWARNRKFWNAYGPTEATVCATLAPADAADPRPPALGRPLPGVSTFVLDAAGAPCPVGVLGELWVDGITVGRGYLGQPELTAESFVKGRYRTGDLARWRSDGMLEFRGRRDHQVKVRGFRVELGEVAAALEAEPEVTQAVVTVRGDSLLAWVTCSAVVEGSQLRHRLAGRLPAHLVPSQVSVLADFPLLPNGKVDRDALTRLSPSPPSSASPSGRTSAIAATFSEVLGVASAAEDNFFDLGGHSLMAARLVARLTEELGVEVHLRDLFRNPTPAGIDAALGNRSGAAPLRQSETAAAPPEVGDVWPLSPAQRGLWFLHQLEPSSTAYTIPMGALLRGDIDPGRLEAALRAVIERHAALRTTIQQVDGEPRSIVGPTPPHPLELIDAPMATPEDVVADLAATPFDLENGPLIRIRLVRTAPGEAVLAMCVHHIVCDGWSAALITKDLATAWAGEALPVGRSFGEIASRRASAETDDDDLQQDLRWWEQHLTGMEPAELPLDRPRPSTPSGRGSAVPFVVSPRVSRSLEELARQHHTTVFATLLAAWGAFLRRVGRSDDVVLGTPVAGRDDPVALRDGRSVDDVVGLFVNTVALRIDTSGAPSFSELVERAARTVPETLLRAGVPFERVVDALGVERDLSRTPLVQVMLAYHQQPMPVLRLAGLQADEVALPPTTAKFDLVVDLAPAPSGGLEGLVSYSTDVLDETTVRAWLKSFEEMLELATTAPSTALPALFRDDPAAVAAHEKLNANTRANFPGDQSLTSRFLEIVDAHADAVAVSDVAAKLTYAQLRDRAAAVAAHLNGLGVGPGEVVGLRMGRGIELVVAALGVVGAGAAYLPIDPAHPPARVQAVLDQCGVKVVLDNAITALPDAAWADAFRPGQGLSGSAWAYVMATSGSTGTPKSIAVPHRAVMRLVVGTDYAELSADSIVASAANPAFDASTFEVWGPLLNGGRLEILSDDAVLDPEGLALELGRRGITHLFLTTALFNASVDGNPAAFARLDTLMFGGEAVDPRRVTAALKAGPPRRLLHVYGPTECTTFATWHEVQPVEAAAGLVPIGRPISNTTAWVMDIDGCPVGQGWVGELWLGGPGVASEYVGEPELTAAKFVNYAGQRAYRTGDLVRLLPTAELAFVGRLDAQVKVRGFRIELTEIEAALRHHPAVSEVAVTAQDDPDRGRRLVAHVVPRGGEPMPGPAEVRSFLSDRLPDHMVPAVVVALDRLPLTIGGKVDRRALVAAPLPEPHRPHGVAPDEPMSSTEAVLAAIWRDVLAVGQVGLDDNFFDLGGDSILAIRIVARANAAGLGLTPRLAFRHQSVRALAAAAGLSPVEAEQGALTGECPLNPVQLWWLESDPVKPERFVQAQALRLPRDLDHAALAAALEDVSTHHDALRLRLSRRSGEWRAHFAEPGPGSFPLLDAGDLGSRMNLESGPAAVAAIESAQPGSGSEHDRLLLAVNHLCIDAVSWGIVVEDLRTAYEARRAGLVPRLPSKTTATRDWARRLRRPDVAAATDAAWWAKFVPEQVPRIPRDGAAEPTWGDLRTVEVPLPEEAAAALGRGIGRSTAAEGVLAAVVAGLCAWSGDAGVLLTVERHGRPFNHDGIDLSRTVGWLTVLHPLWLEPGLENVATALAEVPDDGLGFGVGRWIQGNDELASLPQPEVSWNHLGSLATPGKGEDGEGFTPDGAYEGPLAHPDMRRLHALDVTSWVTDGRAAVAIAYSAGTHSDSRIQALALAISRGAEDLVAGPEAFAMSGLEAEDLAALLDRLNAD